MTCIDKGWLGVPGKSRLRRECRDAAELLPLARLPWAGTQNESRWSHPRLSPPSHQHPATPPAPQAEVHIPDADVGRPETSTLYSLHALKMRPKLPGGTYQGLSPHAAACVSPRPHYDRVLCSTPRQMQAHYYLRASHTQFPPLLHT